MEGTYELMLGGQTVGTVQVIRQGLYHQFSCRCKLSGDVMFRLVLVQDDKEVDLGILTPMEDRFGVNTRISAKRLGEGLMRFYLKPKHRPNGEGIYPVSLGEPFAYLMDLERAYLIRQSNGYCLAIKEEK